MNWRTCIFFIGLGLLLIMTLSNTIVFTQVSALNESTVPEISIHGAIPNMGIVKPIPEPKPKPEPSENPKPEPL